MLVLSLTSTHTPAAWMILRVPSLIPFLGLPSAEGPVYQPWSAAGSPCFSPKALSGGCRRSEVPHDPSGTGMRRGTDAAKAGPPKRPAAVRVSKSLQGVSHRTQAVLRRRAL